MEDFKIRTLFDSIKNNKCGTKNCYNEILQLRETIEKHNLFCNFRVVSYTEYKFDEKNKILCEHDVHSYYYTEITPGGYLESVLKRRF